MVSAAMKCVKYLLFIFNFVFLISGITLVAIGALVHMRFRDYFIFIGSQSLSAPILLIVVGCVITIIAFFGCCGAIKENYCMMITFSTFLAIIFILELAAGIAAYVYRNQLDDMIRKNMREGIRKYETDEPVQKTWDAVQHDFDCCGIDKPADWKILPKYNISGLYPNSCCKPDAENCGAPDTKLQPKGCFDGFSNMADDKSIIVGGVGVGIAFVQIVGVILACCLASAIKREYEVV